MLALTMLAILLGGGSMKFAGIVLSIGCLVISAVSAVAVPIGVPDAYVEAFYSPTFGTFTNTNCGGTGCLLTETSSYPHPGDLSISWSGLGGTNSFGQAVGFQTDLVAGFFFGVLGPTTSTPVVLDLTTSALTSSGSDFSAMTAYVAVYTNSNIRAGTYVPTTINSDVPSFFTAAASCGAFIQDYCVDYGSPSSSFNLVNYQITVQANQFNQLQEALRGVAKGPLTSGSIDPMLVIDPTWLSNNPGYSLVFSTNLSATEAVPEPLTLSAFAAGLIGLAALRRRKVKT